MLFIDAGSLTWCYLDEHNIPISHHSKFFSDAALCDSFFFDHVSNHDTKFNTPSSRKFLLIAIWHSFRGIILFMQDYNGLYLISSKA